MDYNRRNYRIDACSLHVRVDFRTLQNYRKCLLFYSTLENTFVHWVKYRYMFSYAESKTLIGFFRIYWETTLVTCKIYGAHIVCSHRKEHSLRMACIYVRTRVYCVHSTYTWSYLHIYLTSRIHVYCHHEPMTLYSVSTSVRIYFVHYTRVFKYDVVVYREHARNMHQKSRFLSLNTRW